ncbi:MAG: hypothetical protein WC047_05065 [Kiritimatiellales bacterium]
MIEEIEVQGVHYRGIMNALTQDFPYKITVFRLSGKMADGHRVDKSWQTWKKFSTLKEAEAAWDELKNQK